MSLRAVVLSYGSGGEHAPLLASLFVGLVVASLIARTTAKGLDRR